MLTCTTLAAQKIKSLLQSRGKGFGIRITRRPSPRSGLAFSVNFCDGASASDSVFEASGVNFVVDKDTQVYLGGICLDYEEKSTCCGFTLTPIADSPPACFYQAQSV